LLLTKQSLIDKTDFKNTFKNNEMKPNKILTRIKIKIKINIP